MKLLWTQWAAVASFLGALCVGLGAFGSHGLKNRLDEYSLGVFETAVKYQFYHVFALFAVALLLSRLESASFQIAGWAFLSGVLIFSGSLYALSFTQIRALGAITPIGGVLLIIGWVSLFIGCLR